VILGRVEPEWVAYNEAVRALDQQRSELDSLRGRAAAIFASAGIISAFFANFVLDPKTGLDLLEWVAVGSFCGVAVSMLAVLWPWRWWRWIPPARGYSPTTWRARTASQLPRCSETPAMTRPTIVLVHGAFADGSSWLTNTGVSASRLYWEYKGGFFNVKGVSIPVAVSIFPGEQYQAPRSWTEKAYPNLIYFNEVDKGGHFAAWEQPELFASEVRAGFRSLRQGRSS
jgi:hypothetical protein